MGHTIYFFLNERLVHVMAYQPFWGHILGFTVNSNTVMHIDFLRVSYLEKGTQNLPPEIVITEPSITRGVQIVNYKTMRVSGRALDSDGIFEVTANGIEAFLQRDGSFSVEVPLAIGENTITVMAKDIKMMSTSEVITVSRKSQTESDLTASTGGKRLAFMNAPSGSLIAYATSPGSTAADGTGRNGLYTSALLEHILTPNITIEDLFKRVRTTVRLQSSNKQTPWESTSLEGNFYFKK